MNETTPNEWSGPPTDDHRGPMPGSTATREDHARDAELPAYPKGNGLVFLLFLGYVLFWYLQGGYRFPALGAIRFEFWLGGLLAMLAIFSYLGRQQREKTGLGGWITALLALMGVMVVLSYVPAISLEVLFDRVIKFALLGLFIAAFVTDPKRLRWFVAAFLLVGLKMAEEGVIGMITGSLIWENQGVMRLHGSTPNYAHPNSLGGVMLGFIPFLIYLYRHVPRLVQPVLLIQLVASLGVIVLTGSRTAYVALVIGLWFLIRNSRHRRKAFWLALLVALAAAPMVPDQYVQRATTIVTQEDIEGQSIDTRKQILEDAWAVFADHPFGIGVNAFPSMRADRYGRDQDTHNLYLQIATNLGVQGLLLFAGFMVALVKLLRRTEQALAGQIERLERGGVPRSPPVRAHLHDLHFTLAVCKALYIFLIIRLALGLFGMDLYEIYWWFVAGTGVAIWHINTVAQQRTRYLTRTGPADSDEITGRQA